MEEGKLNSPQPGCHGQMVKNYPGQNFTIINYPIQNCQRFVEMFT